MLRTVCMLSWPTVLEQALQTGAQYVDTAMVGRIGMQASAAVGLTASAMWLITGPLAAIGMGVLSCISKAIGAEDRQKAGIACNQTVLLTLATGVLFGAIALGISPFLPDWLGAGWQIRRMRSATFLSLVCPWYSVLRQSSSAQQFVPQGIQGHL